MNYVQQWVFCLFPFSFFPFIFLLFSHESEATEICKHFAYDLKESTIEGMSNPARCC